MFEIKKAEYINKTFRLEESLVEELAICASQHGISMNALVAQCCRYALDHMKPPENNDNDDDSKKNEQNGDNEKNE